MSGEAFEKVNRGVSVCRVGEEVQRDTTGSETRADHCVKLLSLAT